MIFIVLAVIISIFSFTEFLVFNEEVLLALCFICFIFFVYSISNESISDDFNLQTIKLVSDLLEALNNKMYQEMQLYQYSKEVVQFGAQMKLLHAIFLKELTLIPESNYLLLTEQTSYVFLHEITDKAKTIKSKEGSVQSSIIERYVFSSLFQSTPSIYLVDSNIRAIAPICSNLITYTEIHTMN